jgi:hypothetical protein
MNRLTLGLFVLLGACGDDGPGQVADAPPPPDVAPDAFVCPTVTGAGTMHSASITAAETWTAATSPHILPFDTSIGAAVTVEKCAVVQIGAGKQISVRAGGSITTQGAAGQIVKIEKKDAAEWVNIRTLNGGTLSFTHTTISGGGDPLNGIAVLSGTLDIAGTTPATMPILHADHLTITSSKSSGITLHDGGGFDATSTDVTISGATQFPIATFARAMGTIPTGTYTGNAIDEILVRATGGPEAIVESLTIHDRGVPYRIGYQPSSTLDVGPVTGLATVTIEPGVTMKFADSATFRIDAASGTSPARGALIANGTATKKITFTSASPTPLAGDWYGIWFGGTPDPTTRLDHVKVLFAGKQSVSGSDSCVPPTQTRPNDAAIRLLGGEPATVFITNTEISSSGFHGIDRGFRSATKPSFLPTNTITVGACRETHPRDINGACPGTIPCP